MTYSCSAESKGGMGEAMFQVAMQGSLVLLDSVTLLCNLRGTCRATSHTLTQVEGLGAPAPLPSHLSGSFSQTLVTAYPPGRLGYLGLATWPRGT